MKSETEESWHIWFWSKYVRWTGRLAVVCRRLTSPVHTCAHLFTCHTYHSRTTFFFVLPAFRPTLPPPPLLLPPGDAADAPAAVRALRREPPMVVVEEDPADDDVVHISYAYPLTVAASTLYVPCSRLR